jgi:hypothetical protein
MDTFRARSGRWIGGTALTLGVLVGSMGGASTAWPEERHEERFERHEIRHAERRPYWRFEARLGWRFEVRPGVWSPYYVWWWVDNRVVLLPAPTVTSVQYPNGYYQLYGNGISVPYYWVWVPAVRPPAPPVPPAPLAGPMPPAPAPPPPPIAVPPSPAASAPPAPPAPAPPPAPPAPSQP